MFYEDVMFMKLAILMYLVFEITQFPYYKVSLNEYIVIFIILLIRFHNYLIIKYEYISYLKTDKNILKTTFECPIILIKEGIILKTLFVLNLISLEIERVETPIKTII